MIENPTCILSHVKNKKLKIMLRRNHHEQSHVRLKFKL